MRLPRLNPKDALNVVSVLFLLIVILQSAVPYMASAETTALRIDPVTSNVAVGETFNVNVTVTNVVNLTGWEFKLFYLKAVLNCLVVTEGPFLKTGGSTFRVFNIANDYNSTHGRVLAGCALMGMNVSVSGSGVLARITLKALARGDTPLDLADTKLSDEKIPPQSIPHTTSDGIVHSTGPSHDIAIIAVTPPKTIVGQGYTCRINVTVENQGEYTENFNVTLYANETTIAKVTNTVLANGSSIIMTITWNTTVFAKGNYTVWAYASLVPEEGDIGDNTLADGSVYVGIPGDVGARYGQVDMKDIGTVVKAFGSVPGHPKWKPNTDINDDGKVDMKDIGIVIKHFGETHP